MNKTRKVGRGKSRAAIGRRVEGETDWLVRGESVGEAACQKGRGGCQNEPKEEGIFGEIFYNWESQREGRLEEGVSQRVAKLVFYGMLRYPFRIKYLIYYHDALMPNLLFSFTTKMKVA